MIVVAIIGILAAIAIPNFLKFQAKSKTSEAKSNLGAIFTGQVSYFGENNVYSNFTAINWSPSGSPRYRYTLAGNGAVDNIIRIGAGDLPVAIPNATWTGNVNSVKQSDGTTPVGPIVPATDNLTYFTAGAYGIIGNNTPVKADAWSVNQLRQMVWTDDGI
jgi:type IV pilus assembly protein PilA